MVPFMADRSEWQTPLWAIFTWTSPGAMSRRVTSSAMTSSSVGVSVRIAANIGISSSVAPEWCSTRRTYLSTPVGEKPDQKARGDDLPLSRDGSQGLPLQAGRLARVHPAVPARIPGLATLMTNSMARFDKYMGSDD